MPRSRLGPLAIESRLGDYPSQSCVWRAVHVQLQRSIAVKIFSVPFGATPEARQSLAAEWERLKQVQHASIARCYGGGFEETDAYLAYELIEGETLASQLERRTRLPWESVLELAEPLVDAVRQLHSMDLVYGGLQPDKIMMSGLSPVLVDIRVDRVNSPFHSGRPLNPQQLAFQPPELIADRTSTSPRGDLYSLGAIFYFAVTGRPPIYGDSIDEVRSNVLSETPEPPASISMDCPVWFDKLICQLLEKDPAARPHSAVAVQLALGEVRRRAMSRVGVAEHASAGFSPLQITDQKERDEARSLLGQHVVSLDEPDADATAWHDKPWLLIAALALILGMLAYIAWPLSENQMRQRAEKLLAEETRSSLSQAKNSYLKPMISRFPNGEHTQWAEEQIDRVEMAEARHALSVKINRNLPLKNEAERLFAEAQQYELFGDLATALDKYRGLVTLLDDDPKYRPFVNLARQRIAEIEQQGIENGEAAKIILAKLEEADQLQQSGNGVAARNIWYSVIEMYGHNSNVAPLVARAEGRLTGNADDDQQVISNNAPQNVIEP